MIKPTLFLSLVAMLFTAACGPDIEHEARPVPRTVAPPPGCPARQAGPTDGGYPPECIPLAPPPPGPVGPPPPGVPSR